MTGTGRLSLSLSLSSQPDTRIRRKATPRLVYPSRLGGPEIELQVTASRARRASELSRGRARRPYEPTHTFAHGHTEHEHLSRRGFPLFIVRVSRFLSPLLAASLC